jgi:hypothetical protein
VQAIRPLVRPHDATAAAYRLAIPWLSAGIRQTIANPALPAPALDNMILVLSVQECDRHSMPIRAVCFDVGETLIDETRHWIEWADFLGVSAMTLFTAIGVTMERGQSLSRVFQIFKPGMDPSTARKLRAAQGWIYDFTTHDLYADAIPCLTVLRERGYKVLSVCL